MSFFGNVFARLVGGATDTLGRAYPYFLVARQLIFFTGSVSCAGILFRHHFYDYSHTIGPSMYPTMPSEGNIAWVKKLSQKQIAKSMPGGGVREEDRELRVGDCIEFLAPIFNDMKAGKRIVGMPGDYVVRDSSYSPSVGGGHIPGITDWRSDKEIEAGIQLKDREEPEMIRVPEGHVWVAGDNMGWSRDSRFYGPVPMALIQGKTVATMEGFFTMKTLGGDMRKVPKDEEEWVLSGRGARVIEQEKGVHQTTMSNETSQDVG